MLDERGGMAGAKRILRSQTTIVVIDIVVLLLYVCYVNYATPIRSLRSNLILIMVPNHPPLKIASLMKYRKFSFPVPKCVSAYR